MIRFFARILAIIAAVLLSAAAFPSLRAARADTTPPAEPLAVDLTDSCRVTGFVTGSPVVNMMDSDLYTRAACPADGFAVSFPIPAGTLYLEWFTPPGAYTFSQFDGAGEALATEQCKGDLLNQCHQLDARARSFHIAPRKANKAAVATLRLYGQGQLPSSVIRWERPLEKADLLLVTAHPDDEHIFMGGVLPTVAGELGLDAAVLYMTHQNRVRQNEALMGLYACGLTHHPIFAGYEDFFSRDRAEVAGAWGGEEAIVSYLVETLRRIRPEVVVSHDPKGEYGHAAHVLTSALVLRAVEAASDDAICPESAALYGTWTVKKLYLHLYPERILRMDWSQPLAAFGGRTAYEMAVLGFSQHVSQQQTGFRVQEAGSRHDCALYGLAYTSVGADTVENDFFQNIDETLFSNYVAPTPSPTATPAPSATPAPVAATASPAAPSPSAPPEPVHETVRHRLFLAAALTLLPVLLCSVLLFRRTHRKPSAVPAQPVQQEKNTPGKEQ